MKLQDKINTLEADILLKRARLESLVFSEKQGVKRYRGTFAIAVPALVLGLSLSRAKPILGIVFASALRLAIRFGATALRGR